MDFFEEGRPARRRLIFFVREKEWNKGRGLRHLNSLIFVIRLVITGPTMLEELSVGSSIRKGAACCGQRECEELQEALTSQVDYLLLAIKDVEGKIKGITHTDSNKVKEQASEMLRKIIQSEIPLAELMKN